MRGTPCGISCRSWEAAAASLGSHAKQVKSRTQMSTTFDWSWKSDSNWRPADYESAALPTELFQRIPIFTQLHNRLNISYFLLLVKYLFAAPEATLPSDNFPYFCSFPCRFVGKGCIAFPKFSEDSPKIPPDFFCQPSTILVIQSKIPDKFLLIFPLTPLLTGSHKIFNNFCLQQVIHIIHTVFHTHFF